MSFHCKQVSADRWGIYSDTRLLATVSDRATCEAIMSNFEKGMTKVPSELSAGSQSSKADVAQALSDVTLEAAKVTETPAIRAVSEQTAATVKSSENGQSAQSTHAISDDELAKVLSGKSLKVKELESAVLKAQMSQNQ